MCLSQQDCMRSLKPAGRDQRWLAECCMLSTSIAGAAAQEKEVHLAIVKAGYLVCGGSCCESGIHLEPVAEDVQHEQRQEAEVPLPVQDAKHRQEARC